jgi:hypothetical protein
MPYNIPKYSQKDSKDEVMRRILHGKSPYQSIDRQHHYLHNVQKELDAYQTRRNYITHREQLMQHQRKVNNYIEHHRILGMLSNPNLSEGTKEMLIKKRKKLENLGSHITN